MRLLVVVFSLIVWTAGSVWAASDSEQWCRDNPSFCQCSEPLEATAYETMPPFTIYWNPNDSTLKQCRQDNQLGAFITRGNSTSPSPTASTNTVIRQRLSLGGTQIKVPAVMKNGEGHINGYEAGHVIQNRASQARVNVRWYRYLSDGTEGDGVQAYDFADKTNGPCHNASKWFEIYWANGPASSQWDTESGGNTLPNVYAWVNFSPNVTECCNWGPGHSTLSQANQNVTVPISRGRWYRIEVSANGNIQGGAGLKMQAWRKDVTGNLPEEKIIDTTVTCSGCGTGALPQFDWPVEATTSLTPPAAIHNPTIQMFRYFGTEFGPQFTACRGSQYFSHVVYAAWPTDAGQRIGGASEIEGTGSVVPGAGMSGSIRGVGGLRVL